MKRCHVHGCWGILVVTLIGAFFRFYHLGAAAFRADTIIFYNICQTPLSAWHILTNWFEVFGRTDHSPVAMAYVKAFLNVFHCPSTDFWVRFPCALMGTLAVPVIFLAGRALAGRRFGLFVAALAAVNPFHVQNSMEAYFYALMLPGAAGLLWIVAETWQRRHWHGTLGFRWRIAAAVAVFLTIYSHFTGWFFAGPAMLWICAASVVRAVRHRCPWSEPLKWAVAFGIVVLPLTICPWSLPYILENAAHPEQKANIQTIFKGYDGSYFTLVGDYFFAAGFGDGMLGRIASGLIGMMLVAQVALDVIRRRWRYVLPISFVLAAVGLLLAGSKIQGTPPNLRYLTAVQPVLLVVIGLSIWRVSCLMRRWVQPVLRRGVAWGLCGLVLIGGVYPAFLATQLNGKPTPYKLIQSWANSRLPKGTLVLVDRWFEPWNELKVYGSTNVYFTFTVPNEPLGTFLQNNWRGTAMAFFEKFPDAAYLEIAKTYWDDPGVGPWEWPRQHFRRRVEFRNEAAIRLRELGLLYRNDSDKYNSRIIVEAFYNTREDVVAMARVAGKKNILFFGPEWGYTKLWQQYGDFRDWRVMQGPVSLEVWNLTDVPMNAVLKIKGVLPADRGSQSVFVEGKGPIVFPAGQLVWQSSPVMRLMPGGQTLRLLAPGSRGDQSPLLVDMISVEMLP